MFASETHHCHGRLTRKQLGAEEVKEKKHEINSEKRLKTGFKSQSEEREREGEQCLLLSVLDRDCISNKEFQCKL